MFQFERVTPESLGIDPASILRLLDELEYRGTEVHGLTIGRHGRICFQGFWTPYDGEVLHLLYSASKTLTAVAVGLAVQEGFFSLEDTLEKLFPEYPMDDSMRKVAVRNMLCMACGQTTEVAQTDPLWFENYLLHPAPCAPGTHFLYNNPNVNALSSILEKTTGMKVMDFLRPRLLDPLGISERVWCGELPDVKHTTYVCGGMHLTMEDFARFTLFLLQEGEWEGRQILNRDFLREMTRKQIDTDRPGDHGYGYLTWMGDRPGCYMANGMKGQFGICYPDLDLFVVIQSGASILPGNPAGAGEIPGLVDKFLIPGVGDTDLPVSTEMNLLLGERSRRLTLDRPGLTFSRMQAKVSGGEYRLGTSIKMTDLYGCWHPAGNFIDEMDIRGMGLEFGDEGLRLHLTGRNCDLIWRAAADGYGRNEFLTNTIALRYRWLNSDSLYLEVRHLEEICTQQFLMIFAEDGSEGELLMGPIETLMPVPERTTRYSMYRENKDI